jgi:hypothetical protein
MKRGVCQCGGGDALTYKCQSTKVKPLEQFRFPHSKNLIDNMSRSSALDTGLFHWLFPTLILSKSPQQYFHLHSTNFYFGGVSKVSESLIYFFKGDEATKMAHFK